MIRHLNKVLKKNRSLSQKNLGKFGKFKNDAGHLIAVVTLYRCCRSRRVQKNKSRIAAAPSIGGAILSFSFRSEAQTLNTLLHKHEFPWVKASKEATLTRKEKNRLRRIDTIFKCHVLNKKYHILYQLHQIKKKLNFSFPLLFLSLLFIVCTSSLQRSCGYKSENS